MEKYQKRVPLKTTSELEKEKNNKENTPVAPKKLIPLQKIAKPFSFNRIVRARAIMGDTYDKAKNIKDVNDKLIILKNGYRNAIDVVPNVMKPKKQWHLFDIVEYGNKLNDTRLENLYAKRPNKTLDKMLKKRLKDLVEFERFSATRGTAYIDYLYLCDANYQSLTGIDLIKFSEYITPYYQYLQQEFANSANVQKIKQDIKKTTKTQHL